MTTPSPTDPLAAFHPLVAGWFVDRFETPTDAQAVAWPAIRSGRDVLVAAPTGSGKTLAAFLAGLDDLVRAGLDGTLTEGTRILYVSPLKALGNDIEKNLRAPLAELTARAAEQGLTSAPIRVAVRSGDTPASARAVMAKHPPHVLVTTPESLYILLTADGSRAYLQNVQTVIVDEIHAVAGSKRGSHLALSLERLDRLITAAGHAAPTRIGLSATQKPIEAMAGLLVGTARPTPVIVDVGHARALDLAVEDPDPELGAVASSTQMARVYDRIVQLVSEHRATLVFANTRRLVERVAHALEERLGEGQVAAHHGAMARDRRLASEQRLKAGDVPVVVATASLELGIDVGDVDLVIQLGSPRSVATFLQRVGRSGHARRATPKGRLIATTRDQLVECAALVRAVRRGELDRVLMPDGPLDVLAQQLVAEVAAGEATEDELFAWARRSWPYRELSRADFDAVMTMLGDGVATRRGRFGTHLHRDRVGGRVKARRGARLAAITSGGAIPDRADYAVIADPDETPVGTLDEDFAIESMAGDIFLLGNTSWRIRRVEAGRVRVEDAHGLPPSVPFWLGEAPARTVELSAQVGELRAEVEARLVAGQPHEAIAAWVADACSVPPSGAAILVAYLAASRAVLGTLPTQDTVVAERFFDDSGGMQLVLHSPFGGRLNRAWGLALRKRFCRSFNVELQAAATDDGLVLSLGEQHSFPLDTVFRFLSTATVEDVLTQAILTSPIFAGRFKWNATRSLAVLRHTGGRRVPPQILRMRVEDLLGAIFPDQVACGENIEGDLVPPDHPLVHETLRDCLTEFCDLPGLTALLQRIEAGAVRVVAVDTTEPSPLCHEVLNSQPWAYLDDAPLEERRTRAVSLRRTLPTDLADGMGFLDPAVLAAVAAELAPDPRDADEVHDLLLTLGLLPASDSPAWRTWLTELVQARRATVATWDGGAAWVATERVDLVRAALADVAGLTFDPEPPALPSIGLPTEPDAALQHILRGHLERRGPVTADSLAAHLGLSVGDVAVALGALEAEGTVLRGRFDPDLPADQLCHRRVLARVHRQSLNRLRQEVAPVTPADFMRFLFRWQHVAEGHRLVGPAGLAEAIAQLQGAEVAAAAWEPEILSARIAGYDPAWLDGLAFGGHVVWGRLSPRAEAPSTTGRAVPIALAVRADLPWLLASAPPAPEPTDPLEVALLDTLARRGACFAPELATTTGAPAAEVDAALWRLAGAGLVAADGFGAIRALVQGDRRLASVASGFSALRGLAARLTPSGGRWSLLRAPIAVAPDPELAAEQLLLRWGVLFRELLTRETWAPPWRDLLPILRRREARGELRGGRFVSGVTGEQYARPEAIEVLREVRRRPPPHAAPESVRLSATDPLNLVGLITPGPRAPSVTGNAILYIDGVPVASRESGTVVPRGDLPPGYTLSDDLTLIREARALP